MLNLFKSKLNKIEISKLDVIKSEVSELNIIKREEKKSLSKDFPSSIREWNNSIYVYNKNVLNFIPEAGILAMKLIKSYFNLYNLKLERKLRRKKLLQRLRRLSSNKIYVSNGEFKHTNNKVIITLYLLNRQRHNYYLKLRKRYVLAFIRLKTKLKNRLKLIKDKGIKYNNKSEKKQNLIIKALSLSKKHRLANYQKFKNLYSKYYITRYYNKIVKKSLKRLKLYIYYKQLLYINKSKFNYTYLQKLKFYLEKVYNKNVEFNLVNLKRFYLNSDILSESITLKITKNRRKLLRFLKILINKVKIKKKLFFLTSEYNLKTKTKKLNMEQVCEKMINSSECKSIKNIVLNNIKYKYVTGVRLEAKGRLTRRYTASRSLSKIRYKGNLINMDSSYKNLSSTILRGNLRSNLQYTLLKSKTRIGSFGLKGWVSGN